MSLPFKIEMYSSADFTEVGIMSVEVTFEQIFETAVLAREFWHIY